jgi:hypothetical protein
VVADFIAHIASVADAPVAQLASDQAKAEETLVEINDIKHQLGFAPGKELFSQFIPIPSVLLDGVMADSSVRDFWQEADATSDVFADFDLMSSVNYFLIWTAIGLQYLNIRYGVEGQTKNGVKWEVGIGTSGLLLSVKQKLEDVSKTVRGKFDFAPKAAQSAATIVRPTSHAEGIEFPGAAIYQETITVGGLFEVGSDADSERVQMLAKLASLYWEVNAAPAPNDGIKISARDIFTAKELPAQTLNDWPRGFRLTVGERVTARNNIRPYVCILAPKSISGAKARNLTNFRKSKAGKVAEFIYDYLGSEAVELWFARQSATLNVESGTSVSVADFGATVRCHVFPFEGDNRWAVFPGHAVLSEKNRGVPIETICAAHIGKPLRTEVETSGVSSIQDVGVVQRIFLTDRMLPDENGSAALAVDAGFALLDKDQFRDGLGPYRALSNNIGVANISDWSQYSDRYLVTLDRKGGARFGAVSGQNTAKFLQAPGGKTVNITQALLVRNADARDFAEKGMSGSLVFLLEKDVPPELPIRSAIYAVGYIAGVIKNESRLKNKDTIHVNTRGNPLAADYVVQLLPPVWKAFKKVSQEALANGK